MFSKSSIVQVVSLCGACIALYIGSGFAIMQEVMQYEASYGSLFWAVVLVTAVIYAYTNLSFAANGAREKISRGGDIYAVYCGGKVGTFFDFSAFFCCMSFVIMLGGANSTAMQQWGLPNGVGGGRPRGALRRYRSWRSWRGPQGAQLPGASHHCVPARHSGRICACARHGL